MCTMTNEEWQGPALGGTTHLQVFVNGSPRVALWGWRGPENKATNAQSKPFGTGFRVLQSPQPNLQVPFPLSDFWNCFICKKQNKLEILFPSPAPVCSGKSHSHSRPQPVSFLM